MAVDAFIQAQTSTAPLVSQLADRLKALGQLVERSIDPFDLLSVRARQSAHPAWALFARIDDRFPREALEVAGAEISLATTLQRPFRRHLAELLFGRIVEGPRESERTSAGGLRHLAQQLTAEVERAVLDRGDPLALAQLLAKERMIASLVGDLRQPTTTRHDSVDTLALLTDVELGAAAAALQQAVATGDPVALLVVIAFCLGLPWEVALDTPLSHRVVTAWVARIDPAQGATEVEIRQVMPNLASARAGHVSASTLIRRPLPRFAADGLRTLCALQPDATRLRDFVRGALPIAKDPVPGTSTDCAIKISIARLIRSRGAAMLRLGISREVATFASLDLTLQGESKYHYVTLDADDVLNAISRLYSSLGWGEPAVLTPTEIKRIGSQVTPDAATIRQHDEKLRAAVEEGRVGRRYTSEGLLTFHNAYAIFCASRTALFTSARAASIYKFQADSAHPDASELKVRDKRTHFDSGNLAIPIPTILAHQLRFYRNHLMALDARLHRLLVPSDSEIRRRIAAVLAYEPVPIFFLVVGDTVRTVGSNDVFEKASAPLKGDAYRHFMTNELARMTVSSQEVDASQRRADPSSRSRRTSSLAARHEWFFRVAKAMDGIALSLGIYPVNGLPQKR